MSKLLVYKASAGSGKTFTLAVEYMKHLIRNPYAYRQILAVTFTNKATAEMKERILSQLYGIATGDAGSKAYLERLCGDTGLAATLIQERAAHALQLLIHDYSRFRVETIDSFFQIVLRNLAKELDLNPNLNVELDNDDVLSEAVDTMIARLHKDSPVLNWILDYINEQITDNKTWKIETAIKRFGSNIFNEYFVEKGKTLRQHLQSNPRFISQYRSTLKAIETHTMQSMSMLNERFERLLADAGLTPADLIRKTVVSTYFRNLKNGILGSKIVNQTILACMDDPAAWCAKSSPRAADIQVLAVSDLIPLLNEAEEARQTANFTLNSCRLTLRNLNQLQLLQNIDEAVHELNRENNRFLLSETNALLHSLIRNDDPSFVFEKIGAHIRHIMIDEFQDTSSLQWQNFRLLLLEGLAQGADSLIVGDVKQSIYRWRNSDWSILNNLSDRLGSFPVEVRTLDTNRRSATRIIRFNNLFFRAAVNALNEQHEAELGVPCEALLKAYQDVEQHSPRNDDQGYVKVSFVEADKEEDRTVEEVTLDLLGQEVRHLLASGIQPRDIVLLLRTKKHIAVIADYFDRELGITIISDEAFRLDASIGVNLLVSALRFLYEPNNKVAAAQLALCYQQDILGRDADLHTLFGENDLVVSLPVDLIERQETLRQMPLYELLEELCISFELHRLKGQDAYLMAFLDAVMTYLHDHPAHIKDFLEYWDTELNAKTIPAGESINGIRIMTIHKSKGLEFHTVLMPFCDWQIEDYRNLVWCSADDAPYNELDIVPVNYSSAMGESTYRHAYLHERLQQWVDNLNVLYVGFTRTAQNLIVWSKKPKQGTIAHLIYRSIMDISAAESIEWDVDEPFETGELCPSVVEKHTVVTNMLLQSPLKMNLTMETLHSDVEFKQSNRSVDFMQGKDTDTSDSRFISRGKLLHTLFSDIRTIDDVPAAIDKLVFEGVIDSKEAEQDIRRLTDSAFALPQVQDWYSGRWQLFNECNILYKDEHGELQMRRPDRVMTDDMQTIVVDFKFGQPHAKYNEQVRSYMHLLDAMGYPGIEGYLWYVNVNDIEAVL